MKINGIDGMNGNQLDDEIQRGAKFVIYQYCISILIVTFRRPSEIYFVRGNESGITKGLPFVAVSLILGWWGLPWGPIYTITSLVTNLGGGKDVTQEVLHSLESRPTLSS
jgi:hypothetical protein